MARGRMINNSITKDKRINALSNDTSRLAFTWLITFADCEGRVHGDPAIVRSMLFPRRDMPYAEMESYIQEWQDAGLVIWYEVDNDLYLYFPAFERNQSGLRKNREQPSILPAPPEILTNDSVDPDKIRSNSGFYPDQIPVKLKEKKLIKSSVQASPEIDPFEEMQMLIEQMIGYTVTPTKENVDTINEFIRMGVIREDIQDALAYLSGRGFVVRSAIDLKGSVKTAVGKRTQTRNAKSSAKPYIPEEHATEVY